jgi:RNA polymerase sigma-70 factor (ECF subfamily)
MDAYRRYAPALLRKCERMLQSREDAEDIVHGLFVDMLNRGRTGLELPYLYRAVTNRCINFLRYRENRRRLVERQDAALRGPVRIRCDDQVIGVELLTRLVDRLDRRGREVLVYRFVDEMTQEEIAGLIGISRRAVVKRLARIREEVRKLVANGEGEAA